MAEYSKEKLYFLKLPKDFFKSHEIEVLEAMPNGLKYVNILLKLMCASVPYGGYLRFAPDIPYTPDMIAGITHTDVDTVRVGLEVMKTLGLVEITETGSYFMTRVPEMTESRTLGAERKAIQRKQAGGQMSTDCPPLVHQDIKRLRELDIREDTPSKDSVSMSKQVRTSQKQRALCGLMVEKGFITEDELQDPIWDDLLDGYVQDHGFVDTKIKLEYVLWAHSKYSEGKNYFDHDGIKNRYSWLKASMDTGFRRFDGYQEQSNETGK